MSSRDVTSFTEGWTVFHQARTVFTVLLLVAMVINIVIFILARFTSLAHHPMPSIPVAVSTTTPPLFRSPASAPARVEPGTKSEEKWHTMFSALMMITSVVSIICVIFLVFCALLGVMMIIAGQAPGAGSAAAAFFWGVMMVVLLLPWGGIFPQIACLPCGSPFREMQQNIQAGVSASWTTQLVLWVRYFIYPILIILADILYFGRTSQANTQVASVRYMESSP
ncbi:MAG: hypothetical protein WC975_05950 [Phycisphaerae bacterium]